MKLLTLMLFMQQSFHFIILNKGKHSQFVITHGVSGILHLFPWVKDPMQEPMSSLGRLRGWLSVLPFTKFVLQYVYESNVIKHHMGATPSHVDVKITFCRPALINNGESLQYDCVVMASKAIQFQVKS